MKTNFTLDARSIVAFSTVCNISTLRKGLLILPFFVFIALVKANAQPAVPNYPSLTFNSPVLISGTDLQVDAVYNFPNVTPGVDAHVTIMGMSGGAWLSEIDNTAGAGYYDAFQPYVGAAGNSTSYIDWKFVFKKAGTSTDTILPVLAVTGVDVDGDASALKEFIEAATPGSFALDASTYLNFTFDGVRSKATSTIDNYANIDTNNKRSMFQMNFTNINTILYRNGAITTGGSQVRQTSIYFKSFFNFMTLLPVKLLSFNAKADDNGTNINWTATEEDDLKQYIVQKSTDGKTWKNIARINPAATGSTNSYEITDFEKNNITTYYRLQQAATNGSATFSKIVTLSLKEQAAHSTKIAAIGNTVKVQIASKNTDDYVSEIYTMNGVRLLQSQNKLNAGNNQFSLSLPQSAGKGIYLVVIKNKAGQLIHNQKVPVI